MCGLKGRNIRPMPSTKALKTSRHAVDHDETLTQIVGDVLELRIVGQAAGKKRYTDRRANQLRLAEVFTHNGKTVGCEGVVEPSLNAIVRMHGDGGGTSAYEQRSDIVLGPKPGEVTQQVLRELTDGGSVFERGGLIALFRRLILTKRCDVGDGKSQNKYS